MTHTGDAKVREAARALLNEFLNDGDERVAAEAAYALAVMPEEVTPGDTTTIASAPGEA